MGSRHSGNDIVMVCVPGGTPESLSTSAFYVTDDAPWLDLGFPQKPKSEFQKKLQEIADCKLYRSPESPDTLLYWIRWELWDSEKPQKRRRGEFSLGGGDTGLSIVRAYVEPKRIFSAVEHQRMVDDILQSFEGATWEARESATGVRVRKGFGVEPLLMAITNTRSELQDALGIMRHPAMELAPRRPGQNGLAGAIDLAYSAELAENHIVGWWATHRLHGLHGAHGEIERQLIRQSRELLGIDPTLAKERAKRVAASVDEMQQMLREVNELRRRLAPLRRDESPNLRLIGPAVTRDPRRRRLLDALRRSIDISTIETSPLLSRFRERTFSALFEVWGAVAIVQVLQSLHWQMSDAPRIRWIDTWSPERISWHFSNGNEELDFVYEPHAERRHLAPQPSTGPYLDRLQRAAALMDPAGVARLIALTADASPDYALVLHSPQGVAFTIGDAIASDFAHGRSNNKWDSVVDKLGKVAEKYSRSLCWWSKNALITCSTPASFVLVPGDEAVWLAERAISNQIEKYDVLLIGGIPKDARGGDSINREPLERIIDTLRAHAKDGSRRLPVLPGV